MGKKILNYDQPPPQIIRRQGVKGRDKMEWNGKKDWKKNCYQETSSLSSHQILVIYYMKKTSHLLLTHTLYLREAQF